MTDDPLLQLPRPVLKELYRHSIGSFIELYAMVEHSLRAVLQHVAGVDDATALALFSGVKPDKAMNSIRRLYQARNEEMPEALDHALQQFAVITNLRNDLLHHRVDFQHDPPVTTNRASVINEAAVRETEVNAYTLAHAGEDLGVILLALSSFLHPNIRQCADDLEWTRLQTCKHKPGGPPRKDRPKKKDRPKRQRPH